ncbi:MAG: hypothetical protein FWG66_04005 [Spirochaetes bacterium]|nr:hypothetical protein [Spirochaetota bacterium]
MQISKAKRMFFHRVEAAGIVILYGLSAYFVAYKLLADEIVMLYAYIWNIAIIIEYCLIVLIVFGSFIEEFFRDDKRVGKISSKLMETAARIRKECKK